MSSCSHSEFSVQYRDNPELFPNLYSDSKVVDNASSPTEDETGIAVSDQSAVEAVANGSVVCINHERDRLGISLFTPDDMHLSILAQDICSVNSFELISLRISF
jgi:hypothetical protein